MFGTVFMLIIMLLVSMLMIGIGIYQIKSPKPAWFYSGEEPPKTENVTDLRKWNLCHGGMWVVYGCIIALTATVSSFLLDGALGTVILIGGIMLPIPFMVLWHHRLEKRYLRK